MTALFEQILDKIAVGLIRAESVSTGEPAEAFSLVLKVYKGNLGVFLYNGSRFVRRVEMTELTELLGQ